MNTVLIPVGGLVTFALITNTMKYISRFSGNFRTIEEIEFVQKYVYCTFAVYSVITVTKLFIGSI